MSGRLRTSVALLDSCLDGGPALEHRVLELRSGLGPRRPCSRAGVGRALDLSPRRGGRLERRGLRRLRGLGRGGPCGGGAAQPAAPTAIWEEPTALAAALGPFGAPSSPDRIEVKAEHESSGSAREGAPADLGPSAELGPATPPSAAVVNRAGDGGTDLTIPVLLLVALACISFAVRNAVRASRD